MNNFRQWIADVYHCSEAWGQETTADEMKTMLSETRAQSDPADYVPDTSLSAACAEYWNHLCKAYPD